MSDRFRTETFNTIQTSPSNASPPEITHSFPPLPDWLARRLLRSDENVTWVRGPLVSPWWERYVTHPVLFLPALFLGVACLWVGRLCVDSWSDLSPVPACLGGGIILGAIFVLGGAAGHFTRLVVTNCRVVILQGYDVCRGWSIDELPSSLIRYGMREGKGSRVAIDLDALKTVLGSSSGQFSEAKTILEFGKQLDQIKALENGRH